MIAWLTNDALVALMDMVLGWTAHLPMDVRLLILAIGTSVILTFVRVFTTNQDLLKRCRDDKRTLKGLLRQAKRDGDKEAVARHRTTIGMIGVQAMKAEFKPLLVYLLPFACLGLWAMARMAHVPAVAAEPIEVRAHFSARPGEMIHLVPADGLAVDNGWIRRVPGDVHAKDTEGIARWTLRGRGSSQPYRLLFRHDGHTVEHEVILDGKRSGPARLVHGAKGVVKTEVALKPYRFLGVAPAFVAYMLIAVPFVVVLKRLTRIC